MIVIACLQKRMATTLVRSVPISLHGVDSVPKVKKTANANSFAAGEARRFETGCWTARKTPPCKEYASLALAAPEFGPCKLYANLNRAVGQDDASVIVLIWNPTD